MKNIKTILIVIIAGLVTFLLILKTSKKMMFRLALIRALKMYPRAVVENCERIFRHESGNFKSRQFNETYSPGMEKFSDKYPYGWNSLHKTLWSVKPEYKPIGLKAFTENGTGLKKVFIQFPNMTAGVITMCQFLQNNNNNPGRWFALDANKQQAYNNMIVKIVPTITNSIV